MKSEFVPCEVCQSRKDSVYNTCSLNELSGVTKNKYCVLYKKGQVIFHEYATPTGLYCIHKGKVKIFKHGGGGKDVIIRLAKPSDVIGYKALLGQKPYSISASALEDTMICFLPISRFEQIMKENEYFKQYLMKLLCQSLSQMEERVVLHVTKSVKERVAEAILLLKDTYGNDKNEFAMAVHRDDLASLVGTTIESVVRVLKELKTSNFIRVEGRKITVLNEKELLKISN